MNPKTCETESSLNALMKKKYSWLLDSIDTLNFWISFEKFLNYHGNRCLYPSDLYVNISVFFLT